MDICDVLDEKNVILNLKGYTKDEVIKELVNNLYDTGKIADKEDFTKDIYLREAEGITGIGKGIAIPHGRSDTVIKTSIAVGRADHAIEWEAFDDKPVRFVILFAVRNVDISQHIVLLSKVAVLLCKDKVIDELFTLNNENEIVELLGKGVE